MNAIKFKMKKSDEKDYVIVNDDGKGQEGIGCNCATLHWASRFVQFLIAPESTYHPTSTYRHPSCSK